MIKSINSEVKGYRLTPYSPPTKTVEDKLEKTINNHMRSTAKKGKPLNTLLNSRRTKAMYAIHWAQTPVLARMGLYTSLSRSSKTASFVFFTLLVSFLKEKRL